MKTIKTLLKAIQFFNTVLLFLLFNSSSFCQVPLDSSTVYIDTISHTAMMRNQIIIKFRDDAFRKKVLFNPDYVSGSVWDFLKTTAIESIQAHSGVSFGTCKRLVKWLDPEITYSIARSGDTVPMPNFRNLLLLEYDGLIMPDSLSLILDTLSEIIFYAEPNAIGVAQFIPNDPDHILQRNLHTGVNTNGFNCSQTNGQIDARGAWDLETGKEFIKVGIVDNGVDWQHPDFGNGTLTDNAIKGGYDYVRDIGINSITPIPAPFGSAYGSVYEHGTQMAGIIGARSNDGFGVAGIAGGNIHNAEKGVSIYSLRVMQNFRGWNEQDILAAMTSDFVPAIIEGASDIPSPNHGFGLDILNNSWTSSLQLRSLEEAIAFAWQNQVTIVASRGNWDADPDYYPWSTIDHPLYPACYREEWVINVGGSNECGIPKTGLWPFGDGNPNFDFDNFGATMSGHNIDVIAPMTNLMVTTTNRAIVNSNNVITYTSIPYNGTSTSAAQVSGVAALLMSYFNIPGTNGYQKYLAPEDVEFILEHSAHQYATQDLDQYGHSYSGGWGLLRSGAALHYIEKPYYDVLHFSGIGANASTLEGTFDIVGYGPNGFALYRVERYKVEKTVNHSLTSNFQILNHWPRFSGSNTYDNSNLNYDHPYVWFQGVPSQNSAQMFGYTYKMIAQKIGFNWVPFPANTWYPKAPANCKFAYSLRVQDIGVGIDEQGSTQLSVYPVPADNLLNIKIDKTFNSDFDLKIVDMSGKVAYESAQVNGTNLVQLDTQKLPSGLYLIEVNDGEQIITKRFVVSH